MTLALTGSGLTIDDVVRVARGGEPVSLDPTALDRMAAARAVVERTLAEGIEAAVRSYAVTPPVDDMAVLVLRVLPTG